MPRAKKKSPAPRAPKQLVLDARINTWAQAAASIAGNMFPGTGPGQVEVYPLATGETAVFLKFNLAGCLHSEINPEKTIIENIPPMDGEADGAAS